MADMSACVEFSAGYFGYFRTTTGHIGLSFDCTGDTQRALICKDPTGDWTRSVFYLEFLQLGCSSTSLRVYDGSGGQFIAGILASDISGGYMNWGIWDFRDDPIRCLTACNTSGICISSGDGYVNGFLQGYWGTS